MLICCSGAATEAAASSMMREDEKCAVVLLAGSGIDGVRVFSYIQIVFQIGAPWGVRMRSG